MGGGISMAENFPIEINPKRTSQTRPSLPVPARVRGQWARLSPREWVHGKFKGQWREVNRGHQLQTAIHAGVMPTPQPPTRPTRPSWLGRPPGA